MELLKETKQKPIIRCKKVQTANVSTPPRERKGGEGGGKEGGGGKGGKGRGKGRGGKGRGKRGGKGAEGVHIHV